MIGIVCIGLCEKVVPKYPQFYNTYAMGLKTFEKIRKKIARLIRMNS